MARFQLRFEGDPILRKKARPVTKIDDKIRKTLDDMVETMRQESGIGLAAPQIGRLRRMVVIDVGDGVYQMINPELQGASEEMEEDIEGCLSLLHFNGTVNRPKWVELSYLDRQGEKKELRAEGLFARCICHELDHLDGILFRDRVIREISLDHPSPEDLAYIQSHCPHKEEGEETETDGSEDREEGQAPASENRGEQEEALS